MMCPYCSEPMTKGYIPSHKQDIVWYPEGEKPDLFGSESPNSVPWPSGSCFEVPRPSPSAAGTAKRLCLMPSSIYSGEEDGAYAMSLL